MAIGIEQSEKDALPRPQHPAYPAMTESFKTAINNIFSGADAQKELTAAARKIDQEIDDNDGYPPFNKQAH